MTTTPVLPGLPEPTWMMAERMAGKWAIPGAFTADQMRDYALAAIAAAQAAQPEPASFDKLYKDNAQGIEIERLKMRVEELEAAQTTDSERYLYIINNGLWHRGDKQTYLSVLVPQGSDLSSPGMREVAIDTAIAASKGAA